MCKKLCVKKSTEVKGWGVIPPSPPVEIGLNIVLFFSQYALRSMNEFFRTLTFSYVYDVMMLCQEHCLDHEFQ